MYCRYLHYNLSELKEHAPEINWDRYFGGIKAGEYQKTHTYRIQRIKRTTAICVHALSGASRQASIDLITQ